MVVVDPKAIDEGVAVSVAARGEEPLPTVKV
jgi:hypothetical protein